MTETKEERRGRALAREAFVARRRGAFDQPRVEAAAAALRTANATLPEAELPEGFPVNDAQRWVPIGPAIVRRGQANDRPRVTGRIRDLAVEPNAGVRAYAAAGQGGLWYTGDGGTTWSPVGGWSIFSAGTGGDNHAQSSGCVLVSFGATVDDDFVMVGTGETVPRARITGHGRFGGIGVLASPGPARLSRPVDENPWETATGLAQFEGLGMCRLVRRPGRVAGSTTAAAPDQVLAATSGGLFLGTRRRVTAPPPARDEFTWARLAGIDALPGMGGAGRAVTDALWLPGGRIVVAVDARGVAFSDDNGGSFTWVVGCRPAPAPATGVQGFSSLAMVPGTNRLYILTGLPLPVAPAADPTNPITPNDTPTVLQVADITVAAPAAVNVPNVPIRLWGTQRDYDQAVVADLVGGTDRLYLGGSTRLGGEDWGASLYCFDVGAGPALVPTPGISRVGAPAPPAPPAPLPGGEGADEAGWIGNNVHADVHAVRLAGPAGARQVWVGCDGGVYLSPQAGRVNSFTPRAAGLAVLQPTFLANHPTSSQFVAMGLQDNGTQVRSGDCLWEEVHGGDGGGTVFHPTRSQFVISQNTTDDWQSAPATGFVRPTQRGAGHNGNANEARALFYSGAAAIATSATEGRIAVGTSRIWLTHNLGVTNPNHWRVLPFSTGAAVAATDPLADGPLPANAQNVGVPTLAAGDINATGFGPLGRVATVKWVSPTQLLALYDFGVVRWVEAPAGRWTATVVLAPAAQPAASAVANPGRVFLTDVAPLATGDFYLTTTGDLANVAIDTCYRWDPVNGLVATGLRQSLPAPVGSPAGTPGPMEPAYSVVVDQTAPARVYVGTVTGVWSRADGAPAATRWTPFVNGLPQAAVQDLGIWTDPAAAAGSPRLLRAAMQARGVWEVDLANNEPRRTYLRAHPRDDRRRFPTPMRNPRRAPTAAEERVFESPDVVVRPRVDAGVAPRWLLGGGQLAQGTVHAYQLWTFQTAFRWLHPAVVADGRWSDTFGDLVQQHRATLRPTLGAPPLPLGRFVDRRLWEAVVGTRRVDPVTGAHSVLGGTRIDPATGLPTTNAAHPAAVYRPGWTTAAAQNVPATEVDLLESVQPRSVVSGVWQVHSELSTVDVLLHHRDTRPLAPAAAFAMLLWRSGASSTTLLGSVAGTIVAMATALAGGAAAATPAGWTLQTGTGGAVLHRLPVLLDARLPRAVSIDVDLSGVAANHFVLFFAIGGSDVDPCTTAPVGLPANPTVRDLARCWPYAALRLVRVAPRP